MAESFDNLDNILPDWAKENREKMSCRSCEQVGEARRRKKNTFL